MSDSMQSVAQSGPLPSFVRRAVGYGEFKTPVFLTVKNLKSFIPTELGENSQLIKFKQEKGR